MQLSKIRIEDICNHSRIDPEYLSKEEKDYLENLKSAAKAYIMSYTGMEEKELDLHEDIAIAALVLISDMYDNRQMYVEKGNVNRVVDTILGMYCVNLL